MEIVLDFDGTCVAHEFPKIGKDIGAVPVLQELVSKGHKLILFTMRSDLVNKEIDPLINPRILNVQGSHLSNAVDWFKENEIPLYGIQTNPTQNTWTSSPKAYGQIIIDDAALGCPLVYSETDDIGRCYTLKRPYVDWEEVRKMLVSQGVL